MHSTIVLFAPLIFVPLSISACRAERLDATTQMSGATTNVDPQFKEVSGALTWKTGKSPFCSGSWIAPNVFLTAAHCFVSDTGKRNRYEREASVTGYVKYAEGLYRAETYEIDDVIPHPSYPEKSDGVAGDALDLALVRVLGRKGTMFANLPTSVSEFLRKGSELWLYGHGHTGAKEGKLSSDGILRAAAFRVLAVDTTVPWPQAVLKSSIGVHSCGIDSGSPYFQKIGGRVVQLGVHTGGNFMSPDEVDELVRLMQVASPTLDEAKRLRILKSEMKNRIEKSAQTNCSEYPRGVTLNGSVIDWLRANVTSRANTAAPRETLPEQTPQSE